MEALSKGTIEPLMVALRDRLGNLEDLSLVTSPKFDVYRKDNNDGVVLNQTWTVDPDFPMTALCLIDTTDATFVADEEYKLYLRYTTGSESPRLGPKFFRVVSD